MQRIDLSICIAVYNHDKYIKQCLDSLVNFEFSNHTEIIIINDKSTDETDYIIKKWIIDNPSVLVKYYVNEINYWQVKTLSKALSYAEGKYITFMDSDDFLIKSSFQKKIEDFKKNPELKVIYSNWVFYRGTKLWKVGFHDYLQPIFKRNKEDIYLYITSNTPLLSISCAIFDKKFFLEIGWFDDSGLSNDRITNIKVFEKIKSNKAFMINYTPVFAYRIHNNNISKNPDLQYNLLMHVIHKYWDKNARNKLEWDALFVTAIRYKFLWDKQNSKKYLDKLFQHSWSNKKQYIIWLCIYHTPIFVLKKAENILRNIKHYFKWRLY